MVLVGILLIAVAAGFTIDLFVENASRIDVDVLGRTFVVNPGWLVVAGIVAVTVFLIGARLVVVGIARVRRHRAALRAAQRAAQERDQLAHQLAVERADRGRGEDVTTGGLDSTAHRPEDMPDRTRPNTRPAAAPRDDNASA
jgi:hypothetical protein